MKRKTMITLALLSALGASSAAWAVDYPLPPANSRLIGQNQYWTVQEGDRNLQAIARHFDTAAMLILEANDTIAPVQPKPGTQVLIPSQMLLPDVPREGIVVNLAELRLYYFPPGENQVQVYPLGIGQLGLETPEMTTRIGQKIPNPTWTPTANIRARYKAMGIELPAVVPAGPDNPMGHHAIRLAAYGGVYLLHGTNADFGIGMRVSSGCIRLRDNDIKALYNTISPGTKVNIINTPIKASVEPDGRRLVEVHQPLSEHIDDDPQTLPITLNAAMTAFKQAPQTDGTVMERAMNYRSGMPIDVTRHAEPGPQSL